MGFVSCCGKPDRILGSLSDQCRFSNYFVNSISSFGKPTNVDFEPAETGKNRPGMAAATPAL